VSTWTKEQGIKITKAAMGKELDLIREQCASSVDDSISAVAAFVASKK
jgi:hypothetical protein